MHPKVRKVFLVAFVVTVSGACGYWYHIAESKCRVPLLYEIGTIDARFNLSTDELRTELSGAESLWEDATGKNLFTYSEGAAFKVDFIYDDRQDTTTKEGAEKARLDTKQTESERVHAEYQRTIAAYDLLKSDYADDVAAYEKRLATYNATVAQTNEKGGATPAEFTGLESEKKALARLQSDLNTKARKMNAVVDSINMLGRQGSLAVEEYNKEVSWYNSLFGTGREFTQGEYQGGRITIYQFDTKVELRNVLAHELGHALSLQHVEDPNAILYYLMDKQSVTTSQVTASDLAEFARVCGA